MRGTILKLAAGLKIQGAKDVALGYSAFLACTRLWVCSPAPQEESGRDSKLLEGSSLSTSLSGKVGSPLSYSGGNLVSRDCRKHIENLKINTGVIGRAFLHELSEGQGVSEEVYPPQMLAIP